MDDEFLEILAKKPRYFSVSMLPSFKDRACALMRDKEDAATADADDAAGKVLASRVEFVTKGLKADWTTAETVAGALVLLEDEMHIHRQAWMKEQELNSGKVVDWYMKKFMRIEVCTTTNATKTAIDTMLKDISKATHVAKENIYCVCINDLNTPHSRSKSKVKACAQLSHHVMEERPERAVSLVFLSDIPNKGAKFGVQDDDNLVWNEYSAEAIDMDCKFAVMSDRGAAVDTVVVDGGALPGCHFGRLGVFVAEGINKHENVFVAKSKLGLRRRPDRAAILPAYRDLLQLESLSAEMDLLTRDRKTTSVEKLAAQKGKDFTKSVLESLLDGVPLSTKDVLLVVDFTPHMGCSALAARDVHAAMPGTNVYYIGLHNDVKELRN
jgi:hypothetical protein